MGVCATIPPPPPVVSAAEARLPRVAMGAGGPMLPPPMLLPLLLPLLLVYGLCVVEWVGW